MLVWNPQTNRVRSRAHVRAARSMPSCWQLYRVVKGRAVPAASMREVVRMLAVATEELAAMVFGLSRFSASVLDRYGSEGHVVDGSL